jgi:hypothetical protein
MFGDEAAAAGLLGGPGSSGLDPRMLDHILQVAWLQECWIQERGRHKSALHGATKVRAEATELMELFLVHGVSPEIVLIR